MTNKNKLNFLIIISIFLSITYLFISVDYHYLTYVMSIRIPKFLSILITGFCIGTASIAFQTIINNRLVTPCLLGMNSLYSLIHTSVVLVFGVSSIVVLNKNLSFLIDLVLMGGSALLIYGYVFKKTNYNILYILLIGTVLSTLFTSITDTMIRAIDPNEYAVLQDSILAGFGSAKMSQILFALILMALVALIFWKDLTLLVVTSLGKNQAINLGINYDKSTMRLLVAVTLYITIATAMIGMISFLGFIIANLSKELFKTYKHKYLMLGSFLCGIIVLLLGQIIIEHVFEFTTVITVFINLFGGLYFLYLIFKNREKLA